MARTLLAVLGVLMALFPKRVTDWYEQVAFENPEAADGKPWLSSAVQAEGMVITLVSLVSGQGYAWLVNLMGFVGLIAMVFPTQYLDWGTRVAYRNPEEIEWVDWFPSVARGLGAIYVLQYLREYRRRHSVE